MRERLFDDPRASLDLALAAVLRVVAGLEELERGDRPGAVGERMEDAFGRDHRRGQPLEAGRDDRCCRKREREQLLLGEGLRRPAPGAILRQIDANDHRVLLRIRIPDRAAGRCAGHGVEAWCRPARECRAGTERKLRTPVERRAGELGDGPVRRDHDTDAEDREEDDEPADRAERTGRRAADRPADDAAVRGPHLHQPEEGDDHQGRAGPRQQKPLEDRPLPDHRGAKEQEQRDEEGAPPEGPEERCAPPLQKGPLAGDERDDREHSEQAQSDRPDLCPDPGLHRRGARPACRTSRRLAGHARPA